MIRIALAAAIALAAIASGPVFAANDYYLKLDGVTGESASSGTEPKEDGGVLTRSGR